MKLLSRLVVVWLLVCQAVIAQTDDPLGSLLNQQPQFLPVEQAFEFDFEQQGQRLILKWRIAPGYYLYKKQFKAVVKGAALGQPIFPDAKQIEDEFFGVTDVFFQQVNLDYPIEWSEQDGLVKIRYQGCAEAGLCYPPTVKEVYLNAVGQTPANDTLSAKPKQFELVEWLDAERSLALTLLLFVALGIGLAFTPCVFPMYPILSGIVLGQGKRISTGKALALSLVYVQGMAITYSLLGLVVASAGVQFQAALQHPVILLTLIMVFALLALAMFSVYELQLPASWQTRLTSISNQQKGGNYLGVLLMGAISGLVASPCTTAPLTGILLYVAQSGDLLLGFSALYALSLGMGVPLILFAITGGKLLPKAGAWMDVVKVVFGFMMLAVALVFVERLVTNLYTELAWAGLGLSLFTYLLVKNWQSTAGIGKIVRMLVVVTGLAASGYYGYAQYQFYQGHAQSSHPVFLRVKSLADFQQKLAQAKAQGKPVMVDLYADWCVACKKFEKYTFPDPAVIEVLSNTVWMQIDLTDNTPTSLEFQEAFDVLGLPTILFFNTQGKEIPASRVTGFMGAQPFAKHVGDLTLIVD